MFKAQHMRADPRGYGSPVPASDRSEDAFRCSSPSKTPDGQLPCAGFWDGVSSFVPSNNSLLSIVSKEQLTQIALEPERDTLFAGVMNRIVP